MNGWMDVCMDGSREEGTEGRPVTVSGEVSNKGTRPSLRRRADGPTPPSISDSASQSSLTKTQSRGGQRGMQRQRDPWMTHTPAAISWLQQASQSQRPKGSPQRQHRSPRGLGHRAKVAADVIVQPISCDGELKPFSDRSNGVNSS